MKFNKAKSMVGELISERTFEAHLVKALQVYTFYYKQLYADNKMKNCL